jgi:hypothetical protein
MAATSICYSDNLETNEPIFYSEIEMSGFCEWLLATKSRGVSGIVLLGRRRRA